MSSRSGHEGDAHRIGRLVDDLPGAVYRCQIDAPWAVTFMSSGIESITGHPAGAFTEGGLCYGDIVLPEDVVRLEAGVSAAVSSGEPFEFEYRVRHRDGGVRHVYEKGRAVVVEGLPAYLEGVILDLSRLKDMERSLEEQEERARIQEARHASLVRAAPIGIGFVVARVFEDVNDVLCTMTGYARAELVGKSARMLYPSESEYAFVGTEKYRQIELSGLGTVETRWRRKSGEVFHVLLSSSPVVRGDLAKGVTFTAVDITSRKLAEQALRESEERFRATFRASPDSISLIRAVDRRYLDVNDTFVRVTGYAREDVVGRSTAEIPIWVDRVVSDRAFATLVARGSLDDLEADFRMKDGTVRTGLLSARMVQVQGEPCTLIFVRDMTDRKLADAERASLAAQLLHAQKMEAIGRLAGGVAHDFNNLLTGISGNVELALGDTSPSDPLRPALEEIRRAVERATGLTRQLLAFSRRQATRPSVHDANALLGGLSGLLARLLGEDVAVVWELAPALPRVRVDAGQIEQVVLNLAVNARDAMPTGGRLTIGSALTSLGPEGGEHGLDAGRYVVLRFEDTGHGMDADTLRHMFEPFFTTKARGTGLGLATSYGIVRAHGGTVEVDSAPGRGAHFRVWLPVHEGPETPLPEAPRPVEPAGAGGAETILVVEDDELVMGVALAALRRHGYRLLRAASGEEALQVAAAHTGPIDLLLSDVVMPGMNGVELAERLVRLRPDVRVLLTSGYSDEVLARARTSVVAGRLLPKPYSPAELARWVREALDRHTR